MRTQACPKTAVTLTMHTLWVNDEKVYHYCSTAGRAWVKAFWILL